MIRKVFSLVADKVLSLFSGVNPGVKRLIIAVFLLIGVPLIGMAIYYTVETNSYGNYTQYTYYYLTDDPRSKGEFDHYRYLSNNRDFYTNAATIFFVGYVTITFFSLWVWQGFQTKKEAV